MITPLSTLDIVFILSVVVRIRIEVTGLPDSSRTGGGEKLKCLRKFTVSKYHK
jgi:hypothetical protein